MNATSQASPRYRRRHPLPFPTSGTTNAIDDVLAERSGRYVPRHDDQVHVAILQALDELLGRSLVRRGPWSRESVQAGQVEGLSVVKALADAIVAEGLAVCNRSAFDHIDTASRREIFQAFCELSLYGQSLAADYVLWLRRARPETPEQLEAYLDALDDAYSPPDPDPDGSGSITLGARSGPVQR